MNNNNVGRIMCTLSKNQDFFLYNATSKTYTEVDPDELKPDRRGLRGLLDPVWTATEGRSLQQDGEIQVKRECWCTQFFQRPTEYCDIQFDTCTVNGPSGRVTCFKTSGAATFVLGFWPVIIFWFCALIYAFFCTDPGRAARQYIRRRLRRRQDSNVTDEEQLGQDLDHLLEQRPGRAAALYRKAVLRERRRLNRRERSNVVGRGHPEQTPDPLLYPEICNTLVLKTKVFQPAEDESEERTFPARGGHHLDGWLPTQLRREHVTLDEMDEELEHGNRCAICLARLEQGDIVGDIPCGHVFHKDCLKDWLRQKNRCPLCQQEGVAVPQYQSRDAQVEQHQDADHPSGEASQAEEP